MPCKDGSARCRKERQLVASVILSLEKKPQNPNESGEAQNINRAVVATLLGTGMLIRTQESPRWDAPADSGDPVLHSSPATDRRGRISGGRGI